MSERRGKTKPKAPRVLVMGVGGSGARAAAALRALGGEVEALSIDTDARTLETMGPDQVIQIGASITRGMSAGGDVELGRQSVEKDSSSIRKLLREVDLLIVVAGLGGGTGSGAVPVVARIAREAGTLVLAMLSIPFKFEGAKTARVAEAALKRVRTNADAIVRVPNADLLARGEANLPVETAMERGRDMLRDGLSALTRVLTRDGVCGLDFACVHAMLRSCDGFCHFAGAEASGEKRAEKIGEELLSHRMLKKGEYLENAAGVMIGLIGGDDLALKEVEIVMERLGEKLPNEVWSRFGVVVDSAFEGRLSAIVLAAEQWSEPLVDDSQRQFGFNPSGSGQGELPLGAEGKGDFTYVDPTVHNNQDLDVPTYIRRDIKLPR